MMKWQYLTLNPLPYQLRYELLTDQEISISHGDDHCPAPLAMTAASIRSFKPIAAAPTPQSTTMMLRTASQRIVQLLD
jgi:hypothetical protein